MAQDFNTKALSAYRKQQAKCGNIVSSVVQRARYKHECHAGCTLETVVGIKPPTVICVNTNTIHVHTERCTVVQPRGEGYTCTLTGHVVAGMTVTTSGIKRARRNDSRSLTNDHWTPGAPTGHVCPHCGDMFSRRSGLNRHVATHDNVAAPRPSEKKRRRVARHITESDFTATAMRCFIEVFTSKTRVDIYKTHLDRYTVDCVRNTRKTVKTTGSVPWIDIVRYNQEKFQRMGKYLNPPTAPYPEMYKDWAGQIYTYWKRIESDLGLVWTPKLVRGFIAVVFARLTSGLIVATVAVIPKHPYFTQHGIEEVIYGKMPAVTTCKTMTMISTLLHTHCHVGTKIKHPYLFTLV